MEGLDRAGRRDLVVEVFLVLGVSLGASAVRSVLDLIAMLTATKPLSAQQATLNTSITPDRPWLDLAFQSSNIVLALVPAALAIFLLRRTDPPALTTIGLDAGSRWRDVATGAGLAALIGIPGLALYLSARAIGINATVVAADLGANWWTVPVLVASALENALLEEIVVVGYLVIRLERVGTPVWAVVVISAVLRGSYHLYQGFGGFIGNVVMGLVFVAVFRWQRRVLPLIIAHTLINIVAFVGYSALKPHVSWL